MGLGFSSWEPAGRLRFQKLRSDPEVFLLTRLVAEERGVSMTRLLRRSRGPGRAASARQLAIYLSHVLLERPQDLVADLFLRDRTTIAHSCHAVEDRRDDPRLEAEFARIEARLREALSQAALGAPEVKHAA
jgi:chromosomal replication initiation ATPase DnaA